MKWHKADIQITDTKPRDQERHEERFLNTRNKEDSPGSIPSVFGASDSGAKIVTFLIITFWQS